MLTRDEIIDAPYGAQIDDGRRCKLAVSHDQRTVYVVHDNAWREFSFAGMVVKAKMPEE